MRKLQTDTYVCICERERYLFKLARYVSFDSYFMLGKRALVNVSPIIGNMYVSVRSSWRNRHGCSRDSSFDSRTRTRIPLYSRSSIKSHATAPLWHGRSAAHGRVLLEFLPSLMRPHSAFPAFPLGRPERRARLARESLVMVHTRGGGREKDKRHRAEDLKLRARTTRTCALFFPLLPSPPLYCPFFPFFTGRSNYRLDTPPSAKCRCSGILYNERECKFRPQSGCCRAWKWRVSVGRVQWRKRH